MKCLNIALASLLACVLHSCSHGSYHREIVEINTGTLMGPESFPFCGGWVEVWAQIQPEGSRVFLKVSPPNADRWRIWNPHLVVEHPKLSGYVFKKRENRRFDTGVEPTNVISWNLNLGELNPTTGFRVILRPFEGCLTQQQARAVLLLPDGQQTETTDSAQ